MRCLFPVLLQTKMVALFASTWQCLKCVLSCKWSKAMARSTSTANMLQVWHAMPGVASAQRLIRALYLASFLQAHLLLMFAAAGAALAGATPAVFRQHCAR